MFVFYSTTQPILLLQGRFVTEYLSSFAHIAVYRSPPLHIVHQESVSPGMKKVHAVHFQQPFRDWSILPQKRWWWREAESDALLARVKKLSVKFFTLPDNTDNGIVASAWHFQAWKKNYPMHTTTAMNPGIRSAPPISQWHHCLRDWGRWRIMVRNCCEAASIL